ncbi:MAG: hypothetical protein NTX45_01765 [Proteobacteria bacterium]|nr:hypothetical protein [Pseudomonadota bacterium]
MNIKNKYSRTVIGSIFTLLLALTAQLAVADSGPSVLPATAHAYGKDYAGWSAAWLKWALSIPAATNPILDTTGDYANIGQSGKVWFLAGTTTSGITKRTITIPAGTALFFPIVNYFWLNLPELPAPYADPVWSPKQEAYVRDYLAGVVDTATGLSLKVDGRTLKNPEDFRFQSNPPVMVYVPQDDIFNLT